VTECQGCGAWNDASRSVCVLCGTSLIETDEWGAGEDLPPLPPLPDGGLRATMPAWLRDEDGGRRTEDGGGSTLPTDISDPRPSTSDPRPSVSVLRPPSSVPLGPRADPRTFLTDDDFPKWLRDLAAREVRVSASASDTVAPPPEWPDWPGLPMPEAADDEPATVQTPALDGRPPAAVVVARALEERRMRSPWETLLLVILFIGVIVAALWALVSNGVFSPSL
jgi:hypothetical protein